MINKNNTAIIFGCSPFINKLSQNDINYLIDNYYHIGINNFIQIYPNIKNVLFADYGTYEWIRPSLYGQNILLSQTAYHHNFELDNREKPKNIKYVFDARSEIFHDLSKNMLCMYKTSALPAINYVYLKGYKNIVLCGVDLTENWNHFYSEQYISNDIIRSPKRINKMRELLYQFKDYINLYQLNPESDLNIEKINIGEL
jgi:hypothetical protein